MSPKNPRLNGGSSNQVPHAKGCIVSYYRWPFGCGAGAGELRKLPGGPSAKNGGIILTGLGTPNQMSKEVQKGVVAEFLLWDPAVMGKIAADFADEIVTKKLEVKPGVTLDVPDVGKVTVGDKNVVYARDHPLAFDKNNITKYNF